MLVSNYNVTAYKVLKCTVLLILPKLYYTLTFSQTNDQDPWIAYNIMHVAHSTFVTGH